MNYWANKVERREQARKHTREMVNKYTSEIRYSVDNSIVQPANIDIKISNKEYNTSIVLINSTSELSVEQDSGILNFASYHNAGGKFYNGSSAQEESLCHHSFLFNVLNDNRFNEEFYSRHETNNGLYDSDLIISPNIIFDNNISCTVVTCAAVNAKIAKERGISDEVIYQVMKDRINKVLYAFYRADCKVLILGAFGCGVFRNNCNMVASIFRDLLESTYFGCFEKVIFAVPDDENYNVFVNIFSEVI